MTHLNDLSKVYLETIAESAVPGKPAERLGAVTAIPKDQQDAARERILAKTAAKREKMKEALDPVGQEDADVDNDGKKNTNADKYLIKRRKAIGKALATRKEETEITEIHKQAHGPHEVPSKNLKGLVAKAVKRIDTDVDGDTDNNDKAKGELGEFIPGVGNKRLYSTTKTTTAKESFSNWRQDISEVISDIESQPIKEKKVNNKIKINPKLGEAIEELGGTLIEMIEIDENIATGKAAVSEAVKGQDTEMRKTAAADRKSGEKRLPPSSGKGYADQQKQSISYMDKLTKKNKNVVGLVTKEDVEQIDEKAVSKAQQRFMGMVHAVKKGDMEAPSAAVAKAAESMTDKEAKKFAKTKHKGLPEKKEVKEGATEAPMSPQELALQKRKTAIDQQIAQKRRQALNQAGKPQQDMNEEDYDRMKDERMMRGGVDGNTNYRKPASTQVGPKKEPKKGVMSAIDIVKAQVRAKHGKGAIIGD